MNIMDLEQAKDILIDCMSDDELITEYNEYCESNSDMDGIIYSMDEFDEVAVSFTPIELVSNAMNGEFDPSDDWFTFDGYGNLQSFSNCDVFTFFCENVDDDYIIELAEQYE